MGGKTRKCVTVCWDKVTCFSASTNSYATAGSAVTRNLLKIDPSNLPSQAPADCLWLTGDPQEVERARCQRRALVPHRAEGRNSGLNIWLGLAAQLLPHVHLWLRHRHGRHRELVVRTQVPVDEDVRPRGDAHRWDSWRDRVRVVARDGHRDVQQRVIRHHLRACTQRGCMPTYT